MTETRRKLLGALVGLAIGLLIVELVVSVARVIDDNSAKSDRLTVQGHAIERLVDTVQALRRENVRDREQAARERARLLVQINAARHTQHQNLRLLRKLAEKP